MRLAGRPATAAGEVRQTNANVQMAADASYENAAEVGTRFGFATCPREYKPY